MIISVRVYWKRWLLKYVYIGKVRSFRRWIVQIVVVTFQCNISPIPYVIKEVDTTCEDYADSLSLFHIPTFTSSTVTDLQVWLINPLRAKFFRGNINIYLHFVLFLHIDATQVVEILPQIRQEPTYSTWSISWLLMSWRRKEPGHQQSWYWPS